MADPNMLALQVQPAPSLGPTLNLLSEIKQRQAQTAVATVDAARKNALYDAYQSGDSDAIRNAGDIPGANANLSYTNTKAAFDYLRTAEGKAAIAKGDYSGLTALSPTFSKDVAEANKAVAEGSLTVTKDNIEKANLAGQHATAALVVPAGTPLREQAIREGAAKIGLDPAHTDQILKMPPDQQNAWLSSIAARSVVAANKYQDQSFGGPLTFTGDTETVPAGTAAARAGGMPSAGPTQPAAPTAPATAPSDPAAPPPAPFASPVAAPNFTGTFAGAPPTLPIAAAGPAAAAAGATAATPAKVTPLGIIPPDMLQKPPGQEIGGLPVTPGPGGSFTVGNSKTKEDVKEMAAAAQPSAINPKLEISANLSQLFSILENKNLEFGAAGALNQTVNKLKQSVRSYLGDKALPGLDEDVSSIDTLNQTVLGISSALAKANIGARVSNFELGTFIKEVGGVGVSREGNQRIFSVMNQYAQRDLAVSRAAQASKGSPAVWRATIDAYDNANPLVDPKNGKVLATTPDSRQTQDTPLEINARNSNPAQTEALVRATAHKYNLQPGAKLTVDGRPLTWHGDE